MVEICRPADAYMNFSKDHLSRYLSHRFSADAQVTDVSRFGRGTSRETWFVSADVLGKEPVDLVFRLDLAAGSFEQTPLDQEYFIYERLGHTDVPAARALWWEDDPAWTAGSFYVREQVQGDWNIPHFLDPASLHDPLRIRISKEHLRNLALVHAVDWQGLGMGERLPVPNGVADCGPNYIATIIRQFEENRVEGDLLFLESADMLRKTAPVASRICLCKGTNGFGEEIFRGEELVAMSDWEEVSIGDPAADFAFMQNFVPEIDRDGVNLWGLDKALDYYESVSGYRIEKASVEYYRGVRMLRLLVQMHRAAKAVHHDPVSAEIRQAWGSTEVAFHCQSTLADAIGIAIPYSLETYGECLLSVEVEQ